MFCTVEFLILHIGYQRSDYEQAIIIELAGIDIGGWYYLDLYLKPLLWSKKLNVCIWLPECHRPAIRLKNIIKMPQISKLCTGIKAMFGQRYDPIVKLIISENPSAVNDNKREQKHKHQFQYIDFAE